MSFGEQSRWRQQRARKKAAEQAHVLQPGERHLLFYGRISSPNGIKGSGDRRQSGNAVAICLKNNLGDPKHITGFFDYGVSGTKLYRPELDRLVAFIMEHRGCDLMVEDIDRLARDARVLLILGGQLMNFGVRIWDINGEVSADELMERGLRAAADWRKITGRGNVDRRENIREGALYAPATFGYRKPRKGKLVVDPQTAPLLKAMYQMVLKEHSLAHIARWLEKRGVTNRKGDRWSGTRVKETLSHKVNIGWVETQFEDGETVRFHHPDLQIIDEDTYAAVREKLRTRPVRSKKAGGLFISQHNAYTLGGKVLCAACGSPMTVVSSRDPAKLQFACRRYQSHDCELGERFRYANIEREVLAALREILTPDFDALFLAKVKEEHEQEYSGTDARRKELKAQIARLSGRIKAAFGDEDSDDDDDFKSIVNGLKDDLKMKKDQLAALKSGYFFGFAASGLSSLPEEMHRLISASPFVPQNEDELELARMLSKIIKNVVATRLDDEHVGIEFDLDFSSQLGQDSGKVVIHRIGVFEETKRRNWRIADLRGATERDSIMLTDEEMARLLAIPDLVAHLSEFDDDVVRNAMNAVVVAMEVDVGLLQATQALGFDRHTLVKRATSKIREAGFALKFMDVMVELRGTLPGERRLARRPRPRRRLRAKYLADGHAIMTLNQTQLGASDEPMSDAQWESVRSAIISSWGSQVSGGLREQLRNHMRRYLDNLFKILREDAIVASVTGANHASAFHSAIRSIERSGALDAAVRALKQHQDAQ